MAIFPRKCSRTKENWTSLICKVFFPAKIFFCYFVKGKLGGKNLPFKRVNLLCKGVFGKKIQYARNAQNFANNLSLSASLVKGGKYFILVKLSTVWKFVCFTYQDSNLFQDLQILCDTFLKQSIVFLELTRIFKFQGYKKEPLKKEDKLLKKVYMV